MKKITAYEVDGTIFTNKKEAEKAEVKHKETLEWKRLESDRAKLLAKVDEINKKLGGNTFENKYGSKFKCGDKVRVTPKFKKGDHVVVIKPRKDGLDYGTVVNIVPSGVVVGFTNKKILFRETEIAHAGTPIGPTAPKFKVGDRVKHIIQNFKDGKPYRGTVCGFFSYPPGNPMVLWDGEDSQRECAAHTLELADDTNPEKTKFKVGDRVRIDIGDNKFRDKEGTVGSTTNGTFHAIWSEKKGDFIGFFEPTSLKKIEPS